MADGWPSVSWRDYVDGQVAAARQRAEQAEQAVKDTAADHAKAHDREHAAVEQALATAEKTLAQRLAAVGDVVDRLREDTRSYMTRAEFEAAMEALTDVRRLVYIGVGMALLASVVMPLIGLLIAMSTGG